MMVSHVRSAALLVALSALIIFLVLGRAQCELRAAPRRMPIVAPHRYTPAFFENLPPAESESPDPDMSLPAMRRMQLALARICVSESGFQVRTNDCTLIYHVLRSRSRTGEVTMGIMRAYSGRSFDRSRTDSHRWIAHLDHRFREPHGWRETVTIPWSARREGFMQVHAHVGDLLRERPSSPCDVRVDHWGARGFRRELHLSNGWQLVQCGETLNDFWSLPSSDELDPEIPDSTESGE